MVPQTQEQALKKLKIILFLIGFCIAFLLFISIAVLFTDEPPVGAVLFVLAGAGFMVWVFKSALKSYKLAKTDFAQYQEIVRKAEQEGAQQREQMAQNYYKEQQRQNELKSKRSDLSAKGIPSCPKCGSTSIATVNRGYSVVTGFIGSGNAVNVCQNCGHRFTPGT